MTQLTTQERLKILGVILIGIVFLIILKQVVPKPVNEWQCQNGKWTKVGNPSMPRPGVFCHE